MSSQNTILRNRSRFHAGWKSSLAVVRLQPGAACQSINNCWSILLVAMALWIFDDETYNENR